MARVFERPRYINQSRNRLLALAVCTESPSLVTAVCTTLAVPPSAAQSAAADWSYLAELALGGTDADELTPRTDIPLEAFLLDSEIGRLSRDARLSQADAATKVITSFIRTAKAKDPKICVTDEQAVFYILRHAIREDATIAESIDSVRARKAAMAMTELQLPSQKIASGTFRATFGASPFAVGISPAAAKFDAWVVAAENLEYRAHPMWVKYCRIWAMGWTRVRAHVAAKVAAIEAAPDDERFKFDALESVCNDTSAYNYNGTLVVYIGSVMCVLDASAASQLRTCLTSLRNADVAFSNYRLCGDSTVDRRKVYHAYQQAIKWISTALERLPYARCVARHMHLAYTRWQNNVGEESARIRVGDAERDIELKKKMAAVHPGGSAWYDLVMSLDIPERSRAEVFKLYHLLPPADIDAKLLHETIGKKVNNENKADPAALEAYIDFCKSYDLARYTSKTRRTPRIKEDEGYSCRDSSWFRRCLDGKLTMPPKDEWGMAQLWKHFPYEHSGDFHTLAAKDSTRVVADLGKYMDRAQSRDLGQTESNELLHAIFGGATLSNGMSMPAWRDKVFARELDEDDVVIAEEAGKSENTKFGDAVRETLSACDTVREFLTEVDQAFRPLAAQTPGVSLRVDAVKHKRKFQTMAANLSLHAPRTAMATSTDIEKWSPAMPRATFHAWQEYGLSTTECPNPSAVRDLWDRLTLFVDRRGYKASVGAPEGNIQGWPATSDTTMHGHILILWAYQCREAGILSNDESAMVLCLIDDAATEIVLNGTPEEAAAKAVRAKGMLKDLYKSLGFVMDEVKSFFSSIKFVYLNELYLDGAQVAHATKTMMRIDRDHTRRFASLPDQCAAAFGTAASAGNQGADPFVAYLMAAWVSFRTAYKVYPPLMDLTFHQQALIGLTPSGMNGLGIRQITAVFATGAIDQLAWFLEFCNTTAGLGLACDISSIISQEPGSSTAMAAFKSPFAYAAATHTSAANAVRTAFRDAARARGLAEPFLSLDAMEDDPAYVSAVEAVMSSGAHEAALLEEIAANMPDSFVDEVLSRVDKTELIAHMLGSKGIGALRRKVQHADRSNLEAIVEAITLGRSTAAAETLAVTGSFIYAKEMRDRYHARWSILNHTYPSPYAMWAFAGEVDMDSDRARRLTTSTFLVRRLQRTVGSSGRNLYDSSTSGIGYKGYKSAATIVAREAQIALHNPVKAKVAAGLAALRWARDHDCHHFNLTDLFLTAWSGQADVRILDLPGKLIEGSAKRLSLRHARNNHIILAFPNTQSSVRVDARAVTARQAGTHHMYDVMAAITTLRCSGLLEAALQISHGREIFSYGFLYKPNSDAIMEVPATREVALNPATFAGIKAFVDINSPMAASARVALSVSAMQEVLRTYVAISARAASHVFEEMITRAEVDGVELAGMEQEVAHVRVTQRATSYAELMAARHIFLGDLESIRGKLGAVTTDSPAVRGAVGDPLTVSTAALSVDEALRAVGKSANDTLAVNLSNTAPDFANAVMEAHKKDQIEAALEHKHWPELKSTVAIGGATASKIITVVDSVRGAEPQEIALRKCLNAMGIAGYQSSGPDDHGSYRHSVVSFCGLTKSILGRLSALARTLTALKGDYSARTVVGSGSPARNITQVLTGQWRLAAARYTSRADGLAESDAARATLLNYQSVFLKTAARSISADGRMSFPMLYGAMAVSAQKSVFRHMGSDDREAELTARLENEGLSADLIGDIRDDDDLCDILTGTCTEANEIVGGVDSNAIIQAARDVLGWVRADTTGAHKATTAVSKYRRATTAGPQQAAAAATTASTAEETAALQARLDAALATAATATGAAADADAAEEIRSAPTGAFFEWVTDNMWDDVKGWVDVDNMFEYYDAISVDQETWVAWRERAIGALGERAFEWPDAYAFEDKDFGENEGTWVA